ncbi:MAG: Acetyltransferase domain [Gaiellaceae bacterium]|nr:Acetyltransferase domain [Gaiellaceae bacterium]
MSPRATVPAGTVPRRTPRAIVARAAEVWRKEGPKSLALRLLGETFYRRLLVLERPFAGMVSAIPPRIPVVVERAGAEHLDEYLELRPDQDRRLLERRFELGEYLFFVRHEGRVAGATWITGERAYIEYLDREVQLNPMAGYLYDLYVRPEYRGKGLDRALYTYLFGYFTAEQCSTLMATANVENRTQLLFERIGFRRSALLGYYRLGPFKRHFTRLEPDQTLFPRGRQSKAAGGIRAKAV